jgi:adenosylcobinamide-phosphate synthase
MPCIAMAAVLLDFMIGEPRRFHPLVGFGWLASKLEASLNIANKKNNANQRWVGTFALALLLAPFILLAIGYAIFPLSVLWQIHCCCILPSVIKACTTMPVR